MAKKKARKGANGETSGNGNVALWKLKDQERVDEINERYPEIVKPLTGLASAFEVVKPRDARVVSGFLRARIAAFSEERRGEFAAFRKQNKLERLEAKEATHRKALAELDELRSELA